MRTIGFLYSSVAAIAMAAGLTTTIPFRASAQQSPPADIHVGAADIGGTVTSSKGPEAGVWVIAETKDLPTKFAKIVVTDDHGRYVLPDLPKANYDVWVRGYGLVDSAKVKAEPGKPLALSASIAPDKAAAAQYYPALYWFSMLKIPPKTAFAGAGTKDGTMPATMRSQFQWLDSIKSNGCVGCHQLGNQATREISPALGVFEDGADAWRRRIESGQLNESMAQAIGRFNTQVALDNFGDWTDRIAEGALPKAEPPRPQGAERNVVVTIWDWGTPTSYTHDEVATDKRNPTVNAYGKIYGSPENSSDNIPVLDPVTGKTSFFEMPRLDPTMRSPAGDAQFAPSPYWGEERIFNSHTLVHNPMFDAKGRVWFTSRVRKSADEPAFCKQGSDLPSAQLAPLNSSGRQLAMYDPKTGKTTLINTCYGTHHLQFGFDAGDTLWMSGGGAGNVVGWFNTKLFEETGDAEKAQGWTAIVVDTDGTGKRAPDDKRLNVSFYGVAPSPVDGSIWGSIRGYPGAIVRINLGDNPPATALSEFYELPVDDPNQKVPAYGPRGMDIDSQGVVWVPLSSGHMGSFDRRKCKGPLNGPNAASGKLCPEGWTFYQFPGPQFETVSDPGSAEASYYTWVDQHNTLGLGNDVPIAVGDESGSLLALVDSKFITLRVPYPLGFFAKGLDGRIDDANAGWKGRGLWSANGGPPTAFHMEGGKGTLPKVVHFQIRPDPLAD